MPPGGVNHKDFYLRWTILLKAVFICWFIFKSSVFLTACCTVVTLCNMSKAGNWELRLFLQSCRQDYGWVLSKEFRHVEFVGDFPKKLHTTAISVRVWYHVKCWLHRALSSGSGETTLSDWKGFMLQWRFYTWGFFFIIIICPKHKISSCVWDPPLVGCWCFPLL